MCWETVIPGPLAFPSVTEMLVQLVVGGEPGLACAASWFDGCREMYIGSVSGIHFRFTSYWVYRGFFRCMVFTEFVHIVFVVTFDLWFSDTLIIRLIGPVSVLVIPRGVGLGMLVIRVPFLLSWVDRCPLHICLIGRCSSRLKW